MSADVPVVTEVRADVADDALAGLDEDRLALTAEDRRWGRRRVRTREGRELHLALPTGSRLVPGTVLFIGEGWYVRIEAALEPVLAVKPGSAGEAIRIAFEVGNRHFTLAIDGDRLLVPADPAMEQLVERLGVPFERTDAAFEPIGGGHRHD
jgi:urease accessory protein